MSDLGGSPRRLPQASLVRPVSPIPITGWSWLRGSWRGRPRGHAETGLRQNLDVVEALVAQTSQRSAS